MRRWAALVVSIAALALFAIWYTPPLRRAFLGPDTENGTTRAPATARQPSRTVAPARGDPEEARMEITIARNQRAAEAAGGVDPTGVVPPVWEKVDRELSAEPEPEQRPIPDAPQDRSGNWVLEPEIHQRILDELPETSEVPYLSIRILKLMTDTLRRFPPAEREARKQARARVAALRQTLAERKRDTSGDPEALEVLRLELLRVDQELEAWRGRVLEGEPVVPEIEL